MLIQMIRTVAIGDGGGCANDGQEGGYGVRMEETDYVAGFTTSHVRENRPNFLLREFA
jgi:hypothetical protein